jgi:hypothetical protein
MLKATKKGAPRRTAGMSPPSVRVVNDMADALTLLKAERDENTCRKDFALSEAVAMGKALEALERPKAQERQASQAGKGKEGGRGNKKNPVEKLSTGNREPNRVTAKVGAAVGVSRITYERAKAVVEAAEKDPGP